MSNYSEILGLVRQDVATGSHETYDYFLNQFEIRNGHPAQLFTESHHSLVHLEIEDEILKPLERTRVSLHQIDQFITLRGISVCRVRNGQHISDVIALSTIPRHPEGFETQLVGHPPSNIEVAVPVAPENMAHRLAETLELIKPGRWRII